MLAFNAFYTLFKGLYIRAKSGECLSVEAIRMFKKVREEGVADD